MLAIALALAPTFLLIVLGYAMRIFRLVPDEFWPSAERATYFIFFPCLLFQNVAEAELDLREILPVAGALVGAIVAVSAALIAMRRATGADGPAFTSILQGSIRPNTYVGLAAAASLFGAEGVALTAIGIAVVVPVGNVICVAVLARWGRGADPTLTGVALGIARNPLIVSVVLGILANALGFVMPPVIGPVVEALGAASLPLGLLAVGAGLDLAAARAAGRHVALATLLKLIAIPALTGALCALFGVGGLPAAVAVLYNGLPTSASSYVLARQMGGDGKLLAGIITATTLAAAASLPVVVGAAMGWG